MINPKVSVCIFSYNFRNYIGQALESVLCQKTNFDFEIIIGDDFSTDGSQEILSSFQEKHPNVISVIYNEKNMGGTINWIRTINACSGKYIALLDGDDYFTDENKLQKQFDKMELDDNCVLCFHSVEEKYENNSELNVTTKFDNKKYHLRDFLSQGWFIRTGSTMFRNSILPSQPPNWVYKFPYRYDTIIHVFLGMKGYAVYIDEVMSVWRKHKKGMSQEFLKDRIANVQTEISLANQLNSFTAHKYEKVVKRYCAKQYSEMLWYLLKTGQWIKNLKLFSQALMKADFRAFFMKIVNKLRK